jgi:hypothetical protein
MHAKHLKLLAAKQSLRTLESGVSYRSLPTEQQKSFQKRLSRGFETAIGGQPAVDPSSSLETFDLDGLAADFLTVVDFPDFVGDLIKAVFDAAVRASIDQMKAYQELMKAATASLSQFAAKISDRAAIDYLDAPCDQEAGESPPRKKKDAKAYPATAIRAAKRILAAEQQRLLRQAVLYGIARLMVEGAATKGGPFPRLNLRTDPYNLRLRNKLIRLWFPAPPKPALARSAAAVSTRPRRVGDLSGGHWVLRFPGSKDLIDLEPVFRGKVTRFLSALSAAGASVRISSTFRPPERAYLMHWSWKIFKGLETGENIPPKAGVEITWWHGNLEASRRGATEMVIGYGIDRLRIAPALNSRHTERKAIDMTIGWSGRLLIRAAQGQNVTISGEPRDGTNPRLIEVGRTYDVIHFLDVAKDPPHWSTDGR